MSYASSAAYRHRYLLFLLSGMVLMWLAFRNIRFEEIAVEIRKARLEWALVVLIPTAAGQFFRAWRWQLLLAGLRKPTPFWPVFHSLLFGYFVNLGLPRAGELSRCITLDRTTEIKTEEALGTVVTERVADLFCLLLVVIAAFVLQWQKLREYCLQNIIDPILALVETHLFPLIGAAAIGIVVLVLVARWLQREAVTAGSRVSLFTNGLHTGIRAAATLSTRRLLLFFVYTALIWAGYFFTSYLWFFALDATSNLSVAAAFTVMAVGSIAKTLPIQAGSAGAYHVAIGSLLLLYGLEQVSTTTYAILNHGFQTLFYLLFGGISGIILLYFRKK